MANEEFTRLKESWKWFITTQLLIFIIGLGTGIIIGMIIVGLALK